MYAKTKMRTRISAILSALFLLVAMTACGGGASSSSSPSSQQTVSSAPEPSEASKPDAEPAAGVSYPMEGGVKLTIGDEEHSYATAVCPWENTEFFQVWQEQTGVTLEYQLISDLSLTIASGEYPDIIINDIGGSYTGGADGAINDGIIVPLDDYLDTYAPDYKAALESDPAWAKAGLTPNKHYAGFMHLRVEAPGASNTFGLMIRQDWLDDLGMEVPETPEEMVAVLKAFRDEKGATAPMSMNSGTLANVGMSGIFTSPFGLVSTAYYHDGGQIHYGAYEPEYKDYLAWLNQLYNEGLLDKNFNTLDAQTVGANIMTGISGVSAGYCGGSLGVWVPTAQQSNPDYMLSGVRSLVAKKGDTPLFSQHGDVGGVRGYITSSCENVEAAVQFLNYAYTEEGNTLMNFGIEGKSFEMADGKPLYLDSMIHAENGFTQAIAQYAFNPAWGPYMHALLGAYTREGSDWVDELCQTITSNVDFACGFIKENFPGVKVSRPEGTYMLFLDCTQWCREHDTTIDQLQKAGWDVGVAWQDGRAFHGPCHIRMNLALPLSRVEEAFQRLKKYVICD